MKPTLAAAITATCVVEPALAAGVLRQGGPGSLLARTMRFLFGGGSGGLTHYGDTACACIGFDRIPGETVVVFEEESNGTENASGELSLVARRTRAGPPSGLTSSVQVSYPADLGAHCEPWDIDRHPKCTGDRDSQPDWCNEPWCYVDPCKCNLPVLPTISDYVPEARYHGTPLFFSYATCGGKNSYSEVVPQIGNRKCKCIGLDNVPGSVKVNLELAGGKKKTISFPGDFGSTCKAWDEPVHPSCTTADAPRWCFQRWCFVDPCECDIDEFPKVTTYLPDAKYQGKSLYYSYETCGSKDFFEDKKACTKQENEEDCRKHRLKNGSNKCAWTGEKCLGWELVEHPLCVGKVKKSAAASPAQPAAWALLAVSVVAARL